MKDSQQALQAFLRSKFEEEGWELDDKTFQEISKAVELVERPNDENPRSINIEVDSEDKITATSFKLWNISQVKTYDLLKFLVKESGVVFLGSNAAKISYGLIMLLFDFYPKLNIKFNKQDSEVLYALGNLVTEEKKNFSFQELSETYEAVLQKKITEDSLRKSISWLKKVKVLRATDVNEYELKEQIKNLKRD